MRATLTYHSIDPSGSPISVHPDGFAAHVHWLTSGRVRVLPLEDLVEAADDGPDAVALTFDDGFVSAREPIRRLLAEHLPVTVFVVTAEVGRSNAWGGRPHPSVPTLPLLSWNDLEDLKARGASIEAHTRTHAALSSLSDAALDDELGGCRADLEARLGTSTHLAYPYGDVDRRVESRASAVFRFGHTTEFRALHPRERPLGLPRLDMYYFAEGGRLERWNQPGFSRAIGYIGLRRMVRHGLFGLPAPGRPRRWTR